MLDDLVKPDISPEELKKMQGTRNSDVPPWMSYAASLDKPEDKKYEDVNKRYEEQRYDDTQTSNQTKEELHRWKEGNDRVSEDYRWVKKEEYADEEARIGTPLFSSTLISMLRTAGLRCWYRDHPHIDKVTLMVQKDANERPMVACWVQHGWMPEFSIMRFDEHDVPLNEKFRGWRTVLLQLLIQGMINEDTIDKHFGKAQGPSSVRYNTTLYEWRNRRIKLKED